MNTLDSSTTFFNTIRGLCIRQPTSSKLFAGTNGGRLEQPVFRQILLPRAICSCLLTKFDAHKSLCIYNKLCTPYTFRGAIQKRKRLMSLFVPNPTAS
jgi:hypothetical protein